VALETFNEIININYNRVKYIKMKTSPQRRRILEHCGECPGDDNTHEIENQLINFWRSTPTKNRRILQKFLNEQFGLKLNF